MDEVNCETIKVKKEQYTFLDNNSNVILRNMVKIKPFVEGSDWSRYEDRVSQYFIANKVADTEKLSHFLTMCGDFAYDTLADLTVPLLPSQKTLDECFKLLRKSFKRKSNMRAERAKFNKMKQDEGETVEAYKLKLLHAVEACKFGDFLNKESYKAHVALKNVLITEALLDRFIVGIRDERIFTSLLNFPSDTLTWDEACDHAQNMELGFIESSERKTAVINVISTVPSTKSQVPNNSNYSRSYNSQRQRQFGKSNHVQLNSSRQHSNQERTNSGKLCKRCARVGWHNENECPAIKWTCHTCNKTGHTSLVCWQNPRRAIRVIDSINSLNEPSTVSLFVEGQHMTFEVDTGSPITAISYDEYISKFKTCKLINNFNRFFNVSGESVDIFGVIFVKVGTIDGDVTKNLEISVLRTKRPLRAIIGRDWLDEIVPTWRNNFSTNPEFVKLVSNEHSVIVDEIKSKFLNIVDESLVNPIQGFTAEIILNENFTPIFHAPYSVPYRLKEKVEQELDRLVKENVLVPIRHSRWASPIVTVLKKNGNVRICIDCKATINQFVKTEHYPLPKIEDIFASLTNCKVFCVLDLTGAYQQLLLSPQSQEYLVINTHRGLYRNTRLAFGVSAAPSIFQCTKGLN